MPALTDVPEQPRRPAAALRRALRGPAAFILTLLAVEFLDELVYGAREAAWPLIRTDLGLTYFQIGLLMSVPGLVSSLVEPVLGVLGDVWKRWLIIIAGGLAFTVGLVVIGMSPGFIVLLGGSMLLYPASGAFVSLSQATLMDQDPSRHEQLMARWTLAGSIGVVAGPLLLGVAVVAGLGWRGLHLAFGFVALSLTVLVWRQPLLRRNGAPHPAGRPPANLGHGLLRALRALRRREVLRWLVLLQFSDFMLDILLGFLALYFVDIAGVSEGLAGTAVAVWAGVGLLGDALIIPLLERVRGLTYLRYSSLVMLGLFPAFLLAPSYGLKLVLLGLMALGNSGWYAILQGRLYSSLPGQSGSVMAIGNVFGLAVFWIPGLLGWVAQRFGLPVTMWLLLLGPLALLIGVPREGAQGAGD
jgi:FSR family fosmidomycin resistance protein-like MFS transporter